MVLIIAAGFLAGAIIAAVTVLAEHSRIAFNSYALYGNGALIVPAILSPFALYVGWTWAKARGGRALELALFVVGLHFGVGLTSLLEVLFFPSAADLTVIDALPGLLLTGAIFVLPSSLLAALAYWVGTHASGTALAAAIIAGVLLSAFLAIFWGLGLGLIAGGAVALAERVPQRRVVIGVALFVALVIVGNLPFMGALMSPLP